MTDHIQPKLTIGIIFKNEIRCLERCMKSLTSLRESIPCELIMADTGSNDGSHEVASNYADILFDFPWINDFSAARNAIMDKASGEWYLTVDADEFLDTDISELTKFFYDKTAQESAACSLIQRNYESLEMDENYSDFMAVRMIKMSLYLRYEGAIHESWAFSKNISYNIYPLSRTILHHDGYAGLDEEQGRAKRERNLSLIRERLKKEPESLAGLQQYIESGRKESDFVDILRKAISLVEKKETDWKLLGPPIYRYAVREAKERNLPELQKWTNYAKKCFPDSFFTRIDVEYIAFAHKWDEKNYDACVESGERYLKAIAEYQNGGEKRTELLYGSLLYCSRYCKQTVLIYLAGSYAKTGNYEQAVQILIQIDGTALNTEQIENYIRVLCKIHTESKVETASPLIHLFHELQNPRLSKKKTEKGMNTFYLTSLKIFDLKENENKQSCKDILRSPHTLFLPLGEMNDMGRAAIIMESRDLSVMQKLLTGIKEWEKFPIKALTHTIQNGIEFPLPNKLLKLETTDNLAVRLAEDKESFFNILFKSADEDYVKNMQKLVWMRGLVLIAVRIFEWEEEPSNVTDTLYTSNTAKGFHLARLFAKVESEFLPRYYSPDILQEENILMLPLLHRFGWYCAQAFAALDQGDPVGYVHKLRAGLNVCPEMNTMVEYLIKNTPQLHQKQENISPELKLLAQQIRNMLSSYPANDPAITAIKKSPAYQKVAAIIESSGNSN